MRRVACCEIPCSCSVANRYITCFPYIVSELVRSSIAPHVRSEGSGGDESSMHSTLLLLLATLLVRAQCTTVYSHEEQHYYSSVAASTDTPGEDDACELGSHGGAPASSSSASASVLLLPGPAFIESRGSHVTASTSGDGCAEISSHILQAPLYISAPVDSSKSSSHAVNTARFLWDCVCCHTKYPKIAFHRNNIASFSSAVGSLGLLAVRAGPLSLANAAGRSAVFQCDRACCL